MQQIKIENFKRYYDDREFPWYRELSADECAELRRQLKARFELGSAMDDHLDLLNEITEMMEVVDGFNAESVSFSLDALVKELRITCNTDIYINWFRFDQIDKLHFEDVDRYFDDIWYPAVDDIEIFDDSLKWLLSVDHEGYIHLARTD